MLSYCGADVADGVPTLIRHWVSCLLGIEISRQYNAFVQCWVTIRRQWHIIEPMTSHAIVMYHAEPLTIRTPSITFDHQVT